MYKYKRIESFNGMPLLAKIEDKTVNASDLSLEEWDNLKYRHKHEKTPIIMPCCGKPGHMRVSKLGTKHFFHAKKPISCDWKPESDEHLLLKEQIYHICKQHKWDAYVEFQGSNKDWIADVYATNGERNIVIEIQISPISRGDLVTRDLLYQRDKVESYWLIRKYPSKLEKSHTPFPFIEQIYLCDEDFIFFNHGIKSVPLLDSLQAVQNEGERSMSIPWWVGIVLSGEYVKFLERNRQLFTQHQTLCDSLGEELVILSSLDSEIGSFQKDLDRLNISLKSSNARSSKNANVQKSVYSCYCTLNDLKMKKKQIFSLSSGWYKKKNSWYLGYVSDEQIIYLKTRINELQSNLTFLENTIGDIKKDLWPNFKPQLFSKSVKSEEKSISEVVLSREVTFQSNLNNSDNWLVTSGGTRVQIIRGLPQKMDIEHALEFQEKGFGKIIEQ